MLCLISWPTKKLNFLHKLHYYIITFSKLDAVTGLVGRLFFFNCGKVHWILSWEGWPVIIFKTLITTTQLWEETNTWRVWACLLGTEAGFGGEMWWRVGGTDRMTDTYYCSIFHINWHYQTIVNVALWGCDHYCGMTLPVTTILLFGHVTLLCESLILIFLGEGSVKLSQCEHHQTDTPDVHTVITKQVPECVILYR